jgi:hypothetical protein
MNAGQFLRVNYNMLGIKMRRLGADGKWHETGPDDPVYQKSMRRLAAKLRSEEDETQTD